MINYSEAIEHIKQNPISLETESISSEHGLNRILAEDIKADRDYPPFNRSAMDGFAVNVEIYNILSKKSLVSQGKCFAGHAYSNSIDTSKVLKITTGAAVPEGLDAVIPIELCDPSCDLIEFTPSTLTPYQNIARKGEDLSTGEIILEKGTVLTPANLQALATVGCSTIEVIKLPKVALITSGDEVKAIDEPILWNEIRNSNQWSIVASLKNLGIEPTLVTHVPDNKDLISDTVKQALDSCDLILLTGGVSMGDVDFIPQVLQERGINKVFHKVAIKPGKPVWFGKNESQTVFGLPGNPLSSFHTFHLFVKPYLNFIASKKWDSESLLLTIGHDSKAGRIDRFFPFQIKEGKAYVKSFNGSGDITASIESNGLILLEKDKSYESGDLVSCWFY